MSSTGRAAAFESKADRRFARRYDAMLDGAERAFLGRARAELAAKADGDVLEIGAGTGAMLPYYVGSVRTLTLLEPSPAMRELLAPHIATVRIGQPPATPRVLAAQAAAIPLPDASVDTVVAGLVLCSVPDVAAVLAQVRRVLRPGGALLFLEHRRGTGVRAALQRTLTPVMRHVAAGCHLDRDPVAALRSAGFVVTAEEHIAAPIPYRLNPAAPFVAGRAVPA